MERQDWEAALTAGESATLELKTTLSDSRKLVETIAAMATIGGGDILVGVRPDGRPVGAELGEGELERLVQRIQAQTAPRIYVDLEFLNLGGARVLHIHVPPGDGPSRSSPSAESCTRGTATTWVT